MRLLIRITATNETLDSSMTALDVSKVTAASAGNPTPEEVMTAIKTRLFDGTLFPASEVS